MGKNGKQPLPYRKRLAAVFASFAIIIMGTASLLESMSLDYYTVLGTLGKIVPAAFALGAIGWVMGMVLDKPRKARTIDYNSLFLNDIIKNKSQIDDSDPNLDDIDDKDEGM